ncbi:MAG: HAD-IIB family hydrolase [Bacilli bacterium]
MKISVIIPSYNREEHTVATVTALIEQSDLSDCEIIVIDDGSKTKSELLTKLDEDKKIRYYYYAVNSGRSCARNKGIANSNGEYIIFLDSGVIPLYNYISNVKKEIMNNPNDILLGITKGFSDDERTANIFEYLDEKTYKLKVTDNEIKTYKDCREEQYERYGKNLKEYKAPWVYAWTNNLILRRDYITMYGDFDENFLEWGGEDTELMLRYYYSGIDINLAENCICFDLPHKKDNQIENPEEYERSFLKRQNYIVERHNYFETRAWIGTNYTDLEAVLHDKEMILELEFDLDSKIIFKNKYYSGTMNTLDEVVKYYDEYGSDNSKLVIKAMNIDENVEKLCREDGRITFIEKNHGVPHLFSDIDGTLVGQEFKVQKEIIDQIEKANMKLILCSGRPIFEQKKLGLKCDMIGMNGAEAEISSNYSCIGAMTKNEVREILNYLEKNKYVYVVYTTCGKYIKKNSSIYPLMYNLALLHSTNPDEILEGIKIYHDIIYTKNIKYTDEPYELFKDKKVIKIEIYTDLCKESEIKKIGKKLLNYNIFSTHISNIEITSKTIEKGKVISELFPGENVVKIAIGDGENDISMFKACNLSISMGNAHPKCKRISNYCVSSIDSNGYSEALDIIAGYGK